jgi:hypothetical protein
MLAMKCLSVASSGYNFFSRTKIITFDFKRGFSDPFKNFDVCDIATDFVLEK